MLLVVYEGEMVQGMMVQGTTRQRRTGRRDFLKRFAVLAGSAVSVISPQMALAQSGPQPGLAAGAITAARLTEKALFVRGPDSNVLVVDSSEGLVLVDGGHAHWVDALHARIAEHFPGRPYRALVNTHWHPEQTGSNELLGRQGTEIIAHENTALWMDTEIWQRWSGRTFAPMPAAALPGTRLFDDGVLHLGDCTLHYGYLRGAHTDGDIWLWFEDEDVLVTGGLVSNGRWPELDWWTGGFIGSMLDSFVTLLTVPTATTRIVPAFGALMSLDELRAQNQMYLTIFDRLHAAFIRAESLDELLQARPTAEFDAQMGDPTQFLTLAWQSIQGHLRDPQNDRILNLP
jgi:glyoxylase-like metal-dependent hydrolase (beta-lactamase superfamily II)